MPDEIKNAVIAAMQSQQVGNAIAASVQMAVQEKLEAAIPDVVSGAVQGALKGKNKEEDPYRTTIHFLAGLIAFCLAVIVGIFNAFPDPLVDASHVVYRMFGGVLAWISVTALVATFSALITQMLKRAHRKKPSAEGPPGWWLAFLMGVPALLGGMAVAYCVRGGAAILNGDTELIGMVEAICRLGPF